MNSCILPNISNQKTKKPFGKAQFLVLCIAENNEPPNTPATIYVQQGSQTCPISWNSKKSASCHQEDQTISYLSSSFAKEERPRHFGTLVPTPIGMVVTLFLTTSFQ